MASHIIEQKTGNGAFCVCTDPDKRIGVSIEVGDFKWFSEPQAAYDWCTAGYASLQGTMRGYSYLNAAYALEDMMEDA